MPPEPIQEEEKTNVNISISILSVLDINEVKGFYSIQFETTLKW